MSFQEALAFVLKHEGGFVDDPADPGGATNHGITIGTLTDWRGGRPTTKDDVWALTQEEATRIYKAWYWDRVRAAEMPAGIGLLMFDMAVNMGVGGAAKMLQQALRVRADGVIGPQTMSALKRHPDTAVLAGHICARRAFHYATRPHFARFGVGWMMRTMDAHAAALRTLSIL